MKNYSNKVALPEHILISAIRYCLGRMTFVVPNTVDATLECWNSLSTKAKKLIYKSIKNAESKYGGLGASIDKDKWYKIIIKYESENSPLIKENLF